PALRNLSNAKQARGEAAAALVTARRGREILARLAAVSPTDLAIQWEAAAALDTLGQLLARSDLAAARQARAQALAAWEIIAKQSPTPRARRNLALGHKKLGALLEVQGELASALDHYRKALALDEELARADSTSTRTQLDLSYSYGSVGLALFKLGDHDAALDHYQKALALREAVAAADAQDINAQVAVAGALV